MSQTEVQPSENTKASSPTRKPPVILAERRMPDPPPQTTATAWATPPAPTTPAGVPSELQRLAAQAATRATFNVLVWVLSARLIALLGVAGGIALTAVVLLSGHPLDQSRLIALGIYAAAIALPCLVLSGLAPSYR